MPNTSFAISISNAIHLDGGDSMQRSTSWTQCHDLLRAVLDDARVALCHAPTNERNRRIIADARAWFDGTDALFTFAYVCEALDLAPDAVRRAAYADAAACSGVPRGRHRSHHPHKQRGTVSP